MKSVSVNSEVTISYPDSFGLMDSEEMKKIFLEDAKDRWAVWDREKHAVLCVNWQHYGALKILLADIKAVALRNQMIAAEKYKERDYNYKFDRYLERKIAGKKSRGYCFEYDQNGEHRYGRIYLFKHGTAIYAVACFSKEPYEKEFEEILDGIKLKKN